MGMKEVIVTDSRAYETKHNLVVTTNGLPFKGLWQLYVTPSVKI